MEFGIFMREIIHLEVGISLGGNSKLFGNFNDCFLLEKYEKL